MDRIEFVRLDMEPKWALVKGWLEPLATFAMGKVKEDRGDESDDDPENAHRHEMRASRVLRLVLEQTLEAGAEIERSKLSAQRTIDVVQFVGGDKLGILRRRLGLRVGLVGRHDMQAVPGLRG